MHARTPRSTARDLGDHLPDIAGAKAKAHAAIAWLVDLWKCMERTRTLGLAAETAFYLFLSLLPLAAVAGLIAARFSVAHWGEVTPLLSSLPPATRDLVANELLHVAAWNEGTVGLLGSAVFVWLASSGIHAIFDTLEQESNASRPWWRKRLLAIVVCTMLPICVVLLAALGPGVEGAFAWFARWVPWLNVTAEPTFSSRALRFMVGVIVVFVFICALYGIGIPAEARRRMPLFPGAVVAVVLETLLGFGYTTYLGSVGTGSAYTAGLTVIGITLTSLYLFALALLIGALVNRKLGRDRECEPDPPRA